jgi:hypothetical protein
VKPVPGPDRLENALRLGCGGLFGLLVGALIVVHVLRRRIWQDFPTPLGWLVIGLSIVACALMALRWGDRFWGAPGRLQYWRPWDYWRPRR